MGKVESGNCLDDDTCNETNPFEEQLVGGTWYCYGASKKEPWDCSQEEDGTKITSVQETVSTRDTQMLAVAIDPSTETSGPPPILPSAPISLPANQQFNNPKAPNQARAEITFEKEVISTDQAPTAIEIESELANLFQYSDESFAVQLIALQTVAEVEQFASHHDMKTPTYIKINSQGSNWYVLILDVFDDHFSAQEAANNWVLSHDPDSKPWVRPIGALKEAARRANASGA